MKISIDGKRFDTAKAKAKFDLYLFDGNNQHTGKAYCSSAGTWYVHTPSQWSNQHSWILMSAEEILSEYDNYLEQEDKEEIANIAKLTWE